MKTQTVATMFLVITIFLVVSVQAIHEQSFSDCLESCQAHCRDDITRHIDPICSIICRFDCLIGENTNDDTVDYGSFFCQFGCSLHQCSNTTVYLSSSSSGDTEVHESMKCITNCKDNICKQYQNETLAN